MPNTQPRIGITGTVYHQNPSQNPTGHSIRCSVNLSTREEAYSRAPPKLLTNKWELLSYGWLTDCFVLCLKNLGDKNIDLGILTSSSVIFNGLSVPPKMVSIVYPTTPLYIRCSTGESQYSLFVVPK